MVVGGPPCQGFSTAGQRVENDNRNKLIDSYINFIRLVQPKIIFFENAKGLFSIANIPFQPERFNPNDKPPQPANKSI